MGRGQGPLSRLGHALAFGAGLLASTPIVSAEEEWSVSCRVAGRIVYAESLPSAFVEENVEKARRLFAGATCISSTFAPESPMPFLENGLVPVSPEDIGAALAALQGTSAGAAIAASGRVNEPRREIRFETVAPEPPVTPGHIRLAVYRDMPLDLALADWERMKELEAGLDRYVPRFSTLGATTILEIGPISPRTRASLCLSIEESGLSCRRGNDLPRVNVATLFQPFGAAPAAHCAPQAHELDVQCHARWRPIDDMKPVALAILEDFPRPIPLPTPAPRN